MKQPSDKLKRLLICVALAAVCLAGYEQLRNNDFVNWDDDQYITKNPDVYNGITRKSIIWAFTTTDVSYWHPLTWLSHMLDCQLFGTAPAGHHITSLLLHIANSILLFILLRQATGALWKSAFVAALFALHPLNTDSVAWVSERKNLLSTVFWMLTSLAYICYSRRPRLSRYLPLFLLFALGLLAKPTLAVLPFVLLLLDYWPLQRLRFFEVRNNEAKTSNLKIVLEKVPLFILSVIAVCISSLALKNRGLAVPLKLVPVELRMANALVSYLKYIAKAFVPRNLAVHYPYPESIPFWQVVIALVVLLCITAVAVWLFRKKPYFIVGWLWFLGTLLPVSGLVQGGRWPAMADRFAYVPLIGLFIIVAWAVPDVLAKYKYRAKTLGLAAASILLVFLVLTHRQASLWKDSFTLFSHALNVTKNNAVMHNNLGNVFLNKNDYDLAELHYRKALKIDPYNLLAHDNLADLLLIEGKLDEAIGHYRWVVQIKPAHADAHNNLAMALKAKGKLAEAVEHFEKALEINPGDIEVRYNIAVTLVEKQEIDRAIAHLNEALKIKPGFDAAREKLQSLLDNRKQKTPRTDNSAR